MWFSWLLIFLILFFMFVHDADDNLVWFFQLMINIIKFIFILCLLVLVFSAFSSNVVLIAFLAFFVALFILCMLEEIK